jgi:hypothetical protein
VFACTVKLTVPPPLPLAGLTLVIQVALLAAVHMQPAAPLTVVEPDPPVPPKFALAGAIDVMHPPSCVTVSVWPAIVKVPVRCGPVLACTVNVTGPAPVPLAGLTLVIHDVPLAAVHEQPEAALTVVDPDPPALAKFALAGAMEVEQPPPCVTVNA